MVAARACSHRLPVDNCECRHDRRWESQHWDVHRASLIDMAATTKVFVAQLVGLPVFGPDGESIGKVRDVVVTLRVDRAPPRVLGMVVELVTRRRIFVPMLRVTSIEPNAVTLATGSVNLRRFHQRPNEVL